MKLFEFAFCGDYEKKLRNFRASALKNGVLGQTLIM